MPLQCDDAWEAGDWAAAEAPTEAAWDMAVIETMRAYEGALLPTAKRAAVPSERLRGP